MKCIKNSFFVFVLGLICIHPLWAQNTDTLSAPPAQVDTVSADSTMAQLMAGQTKKERLLTTATFKGTKIINGQSIEVVHKGHLQLIFQHRFGALHNGFADLFGLDQASTRIGLEYGISNKLTLGIGRSGGGQVPEKSFDGYFKYKLLSQSSGSVVVPISAVFYSSAAIRSSDNYDITDKAEYRLNYTFQLLLARKFSPAFSLQLMPTLVHRNLTPDASYKNDLFALGIASRLKLTKRLALVGEYYYTFPGQLGALYYHSAVAVGVDIETGGHVFQLQVTNVTGMIDYQFIGLNTHYIATGTRSIRLGFNINRMFTIIRQDKIPKQW